jgi:hypothetical protein
MKYDISVFCEKFSKTFEFHFDRAAVTTTLRGYPLRLSSTILSRTFLVFIQENAFEQKLQRRNKHFCVVSFSAGNYFT